ncbi:Transcriptional regulator, contains XRE-family HTH domain [Promicromonospora umidemergens]|uniref:HTH cro/C1-type domain-containing protein n=1 Tax=Promicromonospora umidemergens TaxID=629679 RepID=A0ABP8XR35_9MICO|nr:helix-turn-helix transcriptional regulator [Promicromonospora umidemergens]MCP2285363.1 Transcriptional regulator, contains XRE-family HTH domain [Promicromonospora umidemergens]
MPPRTVAGGAELGAAIRTRREELDMSIEDAAQRAGIGSETWRRYETGSNIRKDKVRAVCSALRWSVLPDTSSGEPDDDELGKDWKEYDPKKDGLYVEDLELNFGLDAAKTFAWGSDVLLDHIKGDLEELARRPRGTHLGELGHSWLDGALPEQWLVRYDYDFVFRLKATIEQLRRTAPAAKSIMMPRLAQTVGEGIVVRLILEQGDVFADMYGADTDGWPDWYDAIVEPDWIIDLMYDGRYMSEDGPWNFENWFDPTVPLPDLHDYVTPEMVEKAFGLTTTSDGAESTSN